MRAPKRSIRRHHQERLRKKRQVYYDGYAKDDKRELGILVDTPTVCSCWMCGNPRRYFGELTIQERRMMNDKDTMRAVHEMGETIDY